MATETRLNQVIKGAPPPSLPPPSPPAPLPALAPKPPASAAQQPIAQPADPLHLLPSSPPQIYLNLLILESSLRLQYLHLVARRRLNTFFLLLLCLWNGASFYALFLRPREDGIGHGGSVYWMVETSEKLALIGGIVTVLLVWGTGQLERGIRWPRRWLGVTNRGIRGFNLRVVVVKRKWYREWVGHLSFLLPLGMWREAGGSDWHLVEHESGAIVEEDLAPGGEHLMLLLLPKSFSPEFRENWEEFRTEYWEKENERRLHLRKKLDANRRTKAREQGGWKWWTGLWRLNARHHARRHHDLEKHAHGHGPAGSRNASMSEKPGLLNPRRKAMRSDSQASHSRQSSRSSTPHNELDVADLKDKRVRRGSSVSSTASLRRKTRERKEREYLAGSGGLSPLTSATVVVGEGDEREERRRRRHEREEKRQRGKEEREGIKKEEDADESPLPTPTEATFIKSEPAEA